ncbi:MFS transporter AraJ [Parabacteroides sp. AM58-2XD]|uniref:MFS transporter AraJ n=1 Tax=Parabacteroides TaxID=375288 RepID=UPI000FE1ECBA|nr:MULTISPECIES: MFS transporter AraJ [Parabacteroides]MCM0720426.1 MFS transporter AraJ [Parabacteroides sp. W1-Q-101]RGZ00015.1 MFS transporter AraJ [Parabacteroides sp. AM58-2XD]GKG76074.1 MFS transporter AraJ [Parabacteroides goldsteinii]GKG80518.1 MFS transporter AraJ [Parabacteroides goldsteinii]
MKKSLIALAFGTLGLGLSEFVMMGILPDVARDLAISIPEAGHLISAYALGVCAGAPLLVLLARTRPLKQILLVLVTIFIVGNLFVSLSPNYWTMMAMRFISGLPHGAFFGVGSIVAERLAAEGKKSEAVAIMISGMTVANLLAVPLGTYISHAISWRATFFSAACWGVVVFWFIWRWVPYVAALPDNGFKGQFRFLRNRAPWLLIFATMFGNGGFFCLYSYITPMLTQVSGFPAADMTIIMVLAGLGMCIGNLLGGRLSDMYTPGRVAAVTQGVMCLTLVFIFVCAVNPWLSVILMCIGTACLFAVSAPQQLLLIQNAKGGEMLGAASVQIAFNMGNALGAYCGGLPIEAGYSYQYAALPGAASAFAGFLLLSWFSRKYEQRKMKVCMAG